MRTGMFSFLKMLVILILIPDDAVDRRKLGF